MACLLCGSANAARRIVDSADDSVAAEVCEECAQEYLMVDAGSPTCELCSEMGDYDLAKLEAPLPEASGGESSSGVEILVKDVLCEEHLSDLQADAS